MTWRHISLAVFGAWFVVSPWAIGPHSGAYLWTAVVLGGLTLLGSLWALWERANRPWRSYLMALFGLYLGLTPYFYGFTARTGSLWMSMLVGAATLAAALWQGLEHRPETPQKKAA
jgi:hypothetical protein